MSASRRQLPPTDDLFWQVQFLVAAQDMIEEIDPQRWGQLDGKRLQEAVRLKAELDAAIQAVLGVVAELRRLVEEAG